MATVLYEHDEIIHNYNAAREILPFVLQHFKPTSIIDIGCGLGNWLSVAKELGVEDILGVDGWYVDRQKLKIPKNEFIEHDLRESFDLKRKYDLLLCLEVAEHLPEKCADDFIASICTHSDLIIFSAAIPNQGGQNHYNEKWPAYWQKIFAKHDFIFYDCLRPIFWNNEKVEWWYKQNIFLVVKQSFKINEKSIVRGPIMSQVHPELYTKKIIDAELALLDYRRQILNGELLSKKELFKIILSKLSRKLMFRKK